MKKNKTMGLILITLSIIIIIVLLVFEFKNTSKKDSPSETSVEKSTDEVASPNSDSTNPDQEIEELQEGGADSDTIAINNLDCQILNLGAEVTADIADMDRFIYAGKEYLYKNGYVASDIVSMDTVTIKYKEQKKMYLMGISNENEYFYIVYSYADDSYSSLPY